MKEKGRRERRRREKRRKGERKTCKVLQLFDGGRKRVNRVTV